MENVWWNCLKLKGGKTYQQNVALDQLLYFEKIN